MRRKENHRCNCRKRKPEDVIVLWDFDETKPGGKKYWTGHYEDDNRYRVDEYGNDLFACRGVIDEDLDEAAVARVQEMTGYNWMWFGGDCNCIELEQKMKANNVQAEKWTCTRCGCEVSSTEVKRFKYKAYLRSPKWQAIREKVFKRSPVCEACLDAPATQVHHKNYSHFGDEILFDLVAVCAACHERISVKDSWQLVRWQ